MSYHYIAMRAQSRRYTVDYESLTPEQQEKAKACKTPEDVLELARKEGYELSEAELEGLAGGGYWCDDHTCNPAVYGPR